MFRHVVLGLLQDGEPQHGYALMKKYRDRVGGHVSTGNFYRELQRLVESGLAQTVDRLKDTDPRRAPYTITDAGRDAFCRWFLDVAQATMSSHDDDVSDRLAFLADVPPPTVCAMLDRLQDDLWIHAKSLERTRDAIVPPKTQGSTQGLPVSGLILARRIRHVAADVAFLAELRETYDAWVAEQQQHMATPLQPNASGQSAARQRQRGRR
jgi:DNA-binding PadR family transcriptional regulator